MRNSSYIIPSKTIESYLITRDKTQVKKLSLTSGASWIHSPAEEFMHGHEIHSVARDNRDLLNIGHAFWLEKITGINPEDRNAVNQALTPSRPHALLNHAERDYSKRHYTRNPSFS